MDGRALPNARFPIEEHPERRPIHSTAGSPPRLSRNETLDASAGGPLCALFLCMDREGASRHLRNVLPPAAVTDASGALRRGAPRNVAPERTTEALTRTCLIRFCHRHYTRATKPMLTVLAGPETTPGRDRHESTSVRMLRAARPRPCGHPLADAVCALPRFLSPADESSEIRRVTDTRHLSSSRSGALVRGDAR